MGEIEELAEQIEGAGEEGGHAKFVGLTMAVLGVLLALCSALLGGARTELITAMVEQDGVSQRYQAATTKHRTLMAQLQQLHALLPADPNSFAAAEKELQDVETAGAKTAEAGAIRALRLEANKILNTVTPTSVDVLRFVDLVRHYAKERDVALKWTQSYDDEIAADGRAAEHYEWAQLCAELGIVLASIALLLGSRKAWVASLALTGASFLIAVISFGMANATLQKAEHEIEEAKDAYSAVTADSRNDDGDEVLLKDIERIERPRH